MFSDCRLPLTYSKHRYKTSLISRIPTYILFWSTYSIKFVSRLARTRREWWLCSPGFTSPPCSWCAPTPSSTAFSTKTFNRYTTHKKFINPTVDYFLLFLKRCEVTFRFVNMSYSKFLLVSRKYCHSLLA